MKLLGLVKLTLFEQLTGQIFWIASIVTILLMVLGSFISELSLSYQIHMFDATSYFLNDTLLLLTAVFMGSHIYRRDFCNKGLAELAIPMGLSREKIILSRLSGYKLTLLCLSLVVFSLRVVLILLQPQQLDHFLITTFHMFILSFVKSVLACIVATFLGAVVRPVLAVLSTVTLFAVGHASIGLSGLQGLSEQGEPISDTTAFLVKVFKVWNPNLLILDKAQGQWETLSLGALGERVLWGAMACLVAYALVCLVTFWRDINPMEQS